MIVNETLTPSQVFSFSKGAAWNQCVLHASDTSHSCEHKCEYLREYKWKRTRIQTPTRLRAVLLKHLSWDRQFECKLMNEHISLSLSLSIHIYIHLRSIWKLTYYIYNYIIHWLEEHPVIFFRCSFLLCLPVLWCWRFPGTNLQRFWAVYAFSMCSVRFLQISLCVFQAATGNS